MGIETVDSRTWEKKVINSRVPVVVDFWHRQCKWCKKLSPYFTSLSRDFENARFAKIDIRKNKANLEIAKKFGIMGTPTLVIFCQGRPIGQIIGYRGKEQLEKELGQFVKIAQDCLVASTLMMYR
jgi:thioredoxin 1